MHSDKEWALVADAQHGRVFERLVPAGAWSERKADAVSVSNPLSHDQGTERPGRVHESVGTTRHAVEPRSDLHTAAKEAFARDLAERLEAAAAAGSYVRLVLVAPPTFLGFLRKAIGAQAKHRLIGSLDKDLVHQGLAEIAPQLDAARPA